MWFFYLLVALTVYGSVRSWRERMWRRERIAGQAESRRAVGREPIAARPRGRIAGTFRLMWGERKGGHRDTAAPYRLGDFFPNR